MTLDSSVATGAGGILPSDAPSPRLCSVQKEYPEQEYGFNLHAERGKGQYIGKVDADSPADLAGLKTGDLILAVNGQIIVEEPHNQKGLMNDDYQLLDIMKTVVRRIKDNPSGCELLVIEQDGMDWYRQRNIPIQLNQSNIRNGSPLSSSLPNTNSVPKAVVYSNNLGGSESGQTNSSLSSPIPPVPMPSKPVLSNLTPISQEGGLRPRPRLCILAKQTPDDEYGFNLHAERGNGHYIGHIDPGSISESAGLEKGQRIVGVNGVPIYRSTPHPEVIELIRQDSSCTRLLVASKAVDEFYFNHELEYSFDDAEHVPRHPPPNLSSKAGTNDVDERLGNNFAAAVNVTERSSASPSPPPRSMDRRPPEPVTSSIMPSTNHNFNSDYPQEGEINRTDGNMASSGQYLTEGGEGDGGKAEMLKDHPDRLEVSDSSQLIESFQTCLATPTPDEGIVVEEFQFTNEPSVLVQDHHRSTGNRPKQNLQSEVPERGVLSASNPHPPIDDEQISPPNDHPEPPQQYSPGMVSQDSGSMGGRSNQSSSVGDRGSSSHPSPPIPHSPSPPIQQLPNHNQQSPGGGVLRNISIAELKREMQGKRKRNDPKLPDNNYVSLKQKHDIIKNL